jgi:hypothetical protein
MRRMAIALIFSFAVASAAPAEPAAVSHWRPAAGASFAIMLSVAPTTVTTPAQVVDLDLFDIKASTVAALKRQGKRVLCYFSVGSWENWRPDKNAFPASVLGKPLDGWPGERYIDIRKLNLLAAPLRARLDRCKQKGFDGVDPDNVDSFDANTGFPLTKTHAINYLRFLAAEAHARGLAIGLKNAAEIAPTLLPAMDFAVTEDCFKQGWCRVSKNFIAKNKPVFAIEYTDNHIDFAAFCRQAKANGLSPLLKRRNLDTWEKRCP